LNVGEEKRSKKSATILSAAIGRKDVLLLQLKIIN